MNPNRGGEQFTPGFESLPAGGPEQFGEPPEQVEGQPKTPESSPSRQATPVVSIPQLPTTPAPMPTASSDDSSSTVSAVPVASDTDRIEKEWIERAKTIISQTKDDPFTQKNEMSKMKAAYIEKRFNKKIKTDEALA